MSLTLSPKLVSKFVPNFCTKFVKQSVPKLYIHIYISIYLIFFFTVMQPAVISCSKITYYPLFELMKHKMLGKIFRIYFKYTT